MPPILKKLTLGTVFIICPSLAFSWCTEPSAPNAPSSYDKPDAPFCLSDFQYSGKHSCSEWEISNFIDEVNDFIRNLNNYADESVTFANYAQEYAECMANEAKEELE